MEIWTSAETYKNVTHEKILILKDIEKKLNSYISNKNYGKGINLWYYLVISLPDGLLAPEFFQEIKKYRKIKKEVEFRLKIDNKQLVESDDAGTRKLICKSILRSIDIAKKEFKIKDFDFDFFESDIQKCFKNEKWIN